MKFLVGLAVTFSEMGFAEFCAGLVSHTGGVELRVDLLHVGGLSAVVGDCFVAVWVVCFRLHLGVAAATAVVVLPDFGWPAFEGGAAPCAGDVDGGALFTSW